MALKDIVESSPALIILGALFVGFVSGVGGVQFLESREEKLRERIIAELKEDNKKIEIQKAELEAAVKETLKKYLDLGVLLTERPLGEKARENILRTIESTEIESGELAKIVRATTGISVKDIQKYGICGGKSSEMRKLFASSC